MHHIFKQRLLISLAGIAIQATAQGATTLFVDDPRPVAKVVETLISQYGAMISYEDPPYSFGDDLEDVTTQVRKDLDKYPAGQAPKVLIPRGGKMTLNVQPIVQNKDVGSALTLLVQSSRAHGGHFRVLSADGTFHIVPTEVRGVDGNWNATTSILDGSITLPVAERTEIALMDEFCKQVSASAHVAVVIGGGIWPGPRINGEPVRYPFGADKLVARDVLVKALALNRAAKRTWELLYDASQRKYFLNVLEVPDLQTKQPTTLPSMSTHATDNGSALPACGLTSTDPNKCQSTPQ